jgi:hypothetical protein
VLIMDEDGHPMNWRTRHDYWTKRKTGPYWGSGRARTRSLDRRAGNLTERGYHRPALGNRSWRGGDPSDSS